MARPVKADEIYIVTVQLAIQATSEPECADQVSALLSDNPGILDWQYLKISGQFLFGTTKIIGLPYEEGQAFC